MKRLVTALLVLGWANIVLATCTSGPDAYSQAVCALSPSQYFILGERHTATTQNQVSGGASGQFTNSPVEGAFPGIPGSGNTCATKLNGSTQVVSITSPPADFFPNSTASAGWSVVFWINPSTSNTENFLGSGGAGSAHYVYSIAVLGPANGYQHSLLQCNSTPYGQLASLGPTYTVNTWHMVAMTTLGAGGGAFTNMKAYADSTAIGTKTTFSGSFCTDQIGGSTAGGLPDGQAGNFFTGTIAQLAYFNTQLSSSDIANLYTVGTTGVNNCFGAHNDWPMTVSLPEPFRFDFLKRALLDKGV